MAYTKSGSPFLYDESSDDVVGVKDRDGGESLFLKLVGNEVQAGNGAQTVILPEIASYAALRAYSGPQTAYYVRGVASIFDGGHGVFRVDSADTTSADNGGTILVDAAGRRWKREVTGAINVRWFVGSSADPTPGIVAAFALANAAAVTGLTAQIHHPGATVMVPPGQYLLTSLAAPLVIRCNVQADGAEFIAPAGYAGEVVRIGYDTAGELLMGANIDLPAVYKAWGSAIVTGSAGVRVANANACNVKFNKVSLFETGIHLGGVGQGTVYCNFWLNNLNYCRTLLRLQPGAGGWCNDNKFYGGNFGQWGVIRNPGHYQIYIDGSAPATTVAANAFFGTSLEGYGSEYIVYAKQAGNNTFYGCHHETGLTGVAVTVAGDTLTKVGHGLSVGDVLMFYATAMPTGMHSLTPYFVVSVPTADTFNVSMNRNGAAVTFSSAGTAVNYLLQMQAYFEGAGADTYDNTFRDLFTPPSCTLNIIQSGTEAIGNGIESRNRQIAYARKDGDEPLFRGVNKTVGAATSRPIFAAYENTTDPAIDPLLWKCALSPKGVLWADTAGAVVGRLYASTVNGQPYYQTMGANLYELPLALKSATLSVSALAVPANGRAISTHTVTGAAVGDFVNITPFNAWPDGIALAWARVSAANTVQIAFHNWTGASISLSTDFKAVVIKA